MELSRDNNYSIAEDTVLNVTSLMQCTDAQRLSLDEMSFGEFTSTNVPTLLTGSRSTVNGALFGPAPADGVPLYIANAVGSTFQDVSAAPADTTLYLCLVPGTDTATYALKACASVYYNAERRGWYETGSQVRVFGECRKVGGAWPVAYKRRYFHPSVAEAYIQTYADGLEITARDIAGCATRGRLSSSPIYQYSTAKEWGSDTAALFKLRADYDMVLEVALTCKTWHYGESNEQVTDGSAISGCYVGVYALDDTTGSEIGCFDLKAISVPGDTASPTTMGVICNIPVGKYALKLITNSVSINVSAGRYKRWGMKTTDISAYPRNARGNTLGKWGAVI